MPRPGFHDGIRCTAVAKATGERCGNIASKGSGRCRHHGGWSRRQEAASLAQRRWLTIRGEAFRQGLEDRLVRVVTVHGKVALAEAWLSACQNGDPVLYREARRAVARRYQSRLRFMGCHDLLAECGIDP